MQYPSDHPTHPPALRPDAPGPVDLRGPTLLPGPDTARRHLLGGAGALVLSLGLPELARGATIVAVRVWPATDYTRVTLESDTGLVGQHFLTADPPRLVIDVDGLELNNTLRELVAKVSADDPHIARVRVGQNQPSRVRIVFDLKQSSRPQVFALAPIAPYRHRLVFDLYPSVAPDLMAAVGRVSSGTEPAPAQAGAPGQTSTQAPAHTATGAPTAPAGASTASAARNASGTAASDAASDGDDIMSVLGHGRPPIAPGAPGASGPGTTAKDAGGESTQATAPMPRPPGRATAGAGDAPWIWPPIAASTPQGSAASTGATAAASGAAPTAAPGPTGAAHSGEVYAGMPPAPTGPQARPPHMAPPPAGAQPQVAAPATAAAPRAPRRGARGSAIDRLIIVAIDPGHGGEDPGATGPSGLREKDVVLAIARQLAERINNQPGMRAMLTRDADFFVPLQERVFKARKVQADLFVSIHADAFVRPHARGASVFALSQSGASSATARWMAQRENLADAIGGVNIGDTRDKAILQTLLDMSTTRQIKDSLKLGGEMLGHIGRVGKLHTGRVEQAGFAVLKAPDIPSILVETGFISNPQEEKRLRSEAYRASLVSAMFNGITRYFARNPPLARTGSTM